MRKTFIVASAAAAVLFTLAPASAAPIAGASAFKPDSSIVQARYRGGGYWGGGGYGRWGGGYGYRRWGYGRGWGWGWPMAGFGLGYGLGYYGGGYPYYYGAPTYYAPMYEGGGEVVAYCARRFKSYDPSTGTYIGRNGTRRACP